MALMTHWWPVYLLGRVVSQRLLVLCSFVLCHGDKTDLAVATLRNGLDLQKSSLHSVISVHFTSGQLTTVSSQSGQRQPGAVLVRDAEHIGKDEDWRRATSGKGVVFPQVWGVSCALPSSWDTVELAQDMPSWCDGPYSVRESNSKQWSGEKVTQLVLILIPSPPSELPASEPSFSLSTWNL